MGLMRKGSVLATAVTMALIGATVATAATATTWNSAGGEPAEHAVPDRRRRAFGTQRRVARRRSGRSRPAATSRRRRPSTATRVYFPDWAGNLYAVDKATGRQVWRPASPPPAACPATRPGPRRRSAGNKVIVGTQGPVRRWRSRSSPSTRTRARLLWSTTLDTHSAAIITQSATVFTATGSTSGRRSQEEALAAFVPGYACCSFRGRCSRSTSTRAPIVWKTDMAPDGLHRERRVGQLAGDRPEAGPALHRHREQLLAPPEMLACVAAAGERPGRAAGVLAGRQLLRLDHGPRPEDRRHPLGDASALPSTPGRSTASRSSATATNCPEPAGPDFDFGQAPALFTVKDGNGKPRRRRRGRPEERPVLGARSRHRRGALGHPGRPGRDGRRPAVGLGRRRHARLHGQRQQQPRAVDAARRHASRRTACGAASTPSPAQLLWQTHARPHGGGTSGPVTTANGVVFGCSLDPLGPHVRARTAPPAAILWKFASGGSCLSGAAISDGRLFWGSGYSNFGFGTPNNKLYAFGLP